MPELTTMARLFLLLSGSHLLACGGGMQIESFDGADLYLEHCTECHGVDGEGSDYGPNLIWGIGEQSHEDVVETILDGSGGMSALDLSTEAAEAIAGFVMDDLRLAQ